MSLQIDKKYVGDTLTPAEFNSMVDEIIKNGNNIEALNKFLEDHNKSTEAHQDIRTLIKTLNADVIKKASSLKLESVDNLGNTDIYILLLDANNNTISKVGPLPSSSEGGSGSGFYNVTKEKPLNTGYYTLEKAILVIDNKDDDKPGMIITFEVSQGKWEEYRFVGTSLSTFKNISSWAKYGGDDDAIKEIALNGKTLTKGTDGKVNIPIDTISVDESLDESSSNPVQNSAVANKIKTIENSGVGGVEVIQEDDTNILNILNARGNIIASTEFAGGSGGGSGSASRIKLTISTNSLQIKEGDSASINYSYDHLNADNESDGIKSTITISIKRGSTETYTKTFLNVAKGEYSLDVSDYLLVGTNDIYIKAESISEEGKVQTKQAYTTINVISLLLTSSFNIAACFSKGGYTNSDTIEIPYNITGSGNKNVNMYVNGNKTPTVQAVNKSGSVNGAFYIKGSTLSAGRNTIQIVADRDGLLSNSIYMDIFKSGEDKIFIGAKFSNQNGIIFFDDHLTPVLSAKQYALYSFDFAVFNADVVPAEVIEKTDDVVSKVMSVNRSIQTYTNRSNKQGEVNVSFICNDKTYSFKLQIEKSDFDISEATQGLAAKLSADGRNNEEAEPGKWESGNITTSFENVDWKSSGWINNALVLRNGAKATINTQPFLNDIAGAGATIELEFTISNVTDKDGVIVSCMDDAKGFQIKSEEAALYTGSTKEVEDEDGNKLTTNVGVDMKFASYERIKVAFVIGKRAEGRLMELYINGVRSKADIYGEGDSFKQDNPKYITFDSSEADISINNIRLYNRALLDDEEVDNYIVDRPTVDEMQTIYEDNDVLNDAGDDIDIDKILNKGKAVIVIVREGGLDPVNAENNKKTDFLSDVYIYYPNGDVYYLKNIYIRIQGTSSTKYPRKNYRFYLAKGVTPELYINGELQGSLKMPIVQGDASVKVLCAKADFSDSSMTMNTGFARLYNDVLKEVNLLTPAQKINSSIRSTINGFPCDMFEAETADGEKKYCGQYNLNNDKSDWFALTGMEGVEGIEEDKCMAFEFLNNSEKLCLFQTDKDSSSQFDKEFDNALEFNFPKDVTWSTATETQKGSITRLFEWVRDCIPANADITSYKDISSFTSQKFKDEVSNYFDIEHLCTWYLFTDYNMSVDQRAKNMISRTWDGLKWYITYYDGDTNLGKRNDSFLAYLYTLTRETWDYEKSKYAFEGHDSWLWCLVLANLSEELSSAAEKLREKYTTDRVLKELNNKQQYNWCAREYNKSGYFKYIIPQLIGVNVKGTLTKYPYIYALNGSLESHRINTVLNRFALLDAKYQTGGYRSDNIDMYMTRKQTDSNNTMTITSNEIYYFGYGTNNQPTLQASQKAEKNEKVTLIFKNAFSVNDPLRIYGASRMKELDMKGCADNITGDINLNKCSVLRKIDLSSTKGGSKGWCLVLDKCSQIKHVNLNGQTNAKTGTLSSSELNFANQSKLEYLDAHGVNVAGVVFTPGAPLSYAHLPETLKSLYLEYLPNLTTENLILDGYSNITQLKFSGCPGLNWLDILSKCNNIKYLRVTDVKLEGDGSDLARWKNANIGGIEEDGSTTNNCKLIGNYQLTSYLDDETYNEYSSYFDELNIRQPEYTMIEFDESVSDDANVSNLDNKTGYKYGTPYKMSGHIAAFMAQRFRCNAKQAVEGTMTVMKLNDENSNYYADSDSLATCSDAKLDGTEGDVMIFEPHYWFKGINDHLNQKHYSCYAYGDKPSSPVAKIISYDEIAKAGNVKINYKLLSGKTDLNASYSADSSFAVCKVNVSGYKKVRFPTVLGSGLMCSLFTDDAGKIIDTKIANVLSGKFEDGMYLIADVPSGSTLLNFTIRKSAEFDCVLLSNSDKIEDMEPDWVEHEECLTAVFETSIVGTKFRSCITGGASAAGMSWTDFNLYSAARKMQQIDYSMSRDIANMFFAKYGRRDSQIQCGAGSHTNARTTGGTAAYGMQDTIGFNEAKTINTSLTPSFVDGINTQYSWYKQIDAYGVITVKQINNSSCLGYEDIYGDKHEMMDNVNVNLGSSDGKWTIKEPDGKTRKVKGSTSSVFITGMVHGKFMDIISAGTVTGSNNTYYCDRFEYSSSTSRVVYRGFYIAHSSGGISCASAVYDASNSDTYVGSRLAFRGKIEKAKNVSAFKNLEEIA